MFPPRFISLCLRCLRVACVVLAAAGCRHDNAGPTGVDTSRPASPPPACTGAPTLTVSGGTVPTFTWTPNCTITGLGIETDDGTDYWILERTATAAGSLASGIVYGTVPAGAVEQTPARPLVAGVRYHANVVITTQGYTFTAASVAFTP